MCCNRINTDVLLANLFANASSATKDRYTYKQLRDYLSFLSMRFPTYLATNFSEHMVVECAAQYPDLYYISKDEEGVVVLPGKQFPNLDYFNAIYPPSVSEYIKKVTTIFLNEKQDEQHQELVEH